MSIMLCSLSLLSQKIHKKDPNHHCGVCTFLFSKKSNKQKQKQNRSDMRDSHRMCKYSKQNSKIGLKEDILTYLLLQLQLYCIWPYAFDPFSQVFTRLCYFFSPSRCCLDKNKCDPALDEGLLSFSKKNVKADRAVLTSALMLLKCVSTYVSEFTQDPLLEHLKQ